jgi:hypothetical protein
MSSFEKNLGVADKSKALPENFLFSILQNSTAATHKAARSLIYIIGLVILLELVEGKHVKEFIMIITKTSDMYLVKSLIITLIAFYSFRMLLLYNYNCICLQYIHIYSKKLPEGLYESGGYNFLKTPDILSLITIAERVSDSKLLKWILIPCKTAMIISLVAPSLYLFYKIYALYCIYGAQITTSRTFFENYTIFSVAAVVSICMILYSSIYFGASFWKLKT